MLESPFARYGLFRNPFGELTTQERAMLAVVDTEMHLDWLQTSSQAVLQVIGPSGHGKSTHLRAVQWAWAQQNGPQQNGPQQNGPAELPAFVYFPEEGDQPALPRSRPLFIDEAQRMSWWRRRQLLRSSGPLALATHSDLSGALSRAGFRVKTVDLAQPLPPERMLIILNRRIGASRLAALPMGLEQPGGPADGSAMELGLPEVVALQERFGSNIRQVEEYLYNQVQQLVQKGQPWLLVE